MKYHLKMKQFIKNSILFLNVFTLGIPHSFAVQIKIKRGLNIQLENANHPQQLWRVTTLPAGTIVEIPDDYLVRQGVDTSNEQSIMNWLRKGVDLYQFQTSTGDTRYDYFTEVKVISVPNPELKKYENKNFRMALKYLAERDKNGLQFVTSESADFASSYSPSTESRTLSNETEVHCSENCFIRNPEPTLPGLKPLVDLTQTLLNQVENKRSSYISTKNTNNIQVNFERTCPNLPFTQFYNYLKNESEKQGIPVEIMLGIMSQESSGRCFPNDSNGNYGLFQINTASGSNQSKLCTQSQLNKLKNANFETMKSSELHCLQNPLVNAQEGIRVLVEKYISVNKNHPKNEILKSWSEQTDQSRDRWRRAIAGYNGGQGHILRVQKDIKDFRDKYASDLDINSFELQRLFFFRKTLRANGYVGANESARSTENSINNLAYTESIAGLNSRPNETNFIQSWEQLESQFLRNSQIASRARNE